MAAWTTVPVFLSSTFRDMHAERDHLVKVVFPALREELEPHRVHLVDIDLRWGVTREQADNDEALAVCLDQIDACRPFFVGILGDRYGYVADRLPAGVAGRHGWARGHAGKSITELEILHGVLNNAAADGRALFLFRDPSFLKAVPAALRPDFAAENAEAAEKLAALKRAIRAARRPVATYACTFGGVTPDGRVRLTDLDAFGRRVAGWLRAAIKAELNLPARPASQAGDVLADEADAHERFMESRLRVYVGREDVASALAAYAAGGGTAPCLVTGPAGSGKSAALAKFVADARRDAAALIVPHFVGAGTASTDPRLMLRRVCLALRAAFRFPEDVSQDYAGLTAQFREFARRAPAGRRVVLVVDALDQLDATADAQALPWLPAALPGHVKVIASCLADAPGGAASPVLRAFGRRPHHAVPVGPLADDERRAILRAVPSLSAKTLDGVQTDLLLANPATSNPLFLLVALEELRGFGLFENLDRRIAALPRPAESDRPWRRRLVDEMAAADAIPDARRRQSRIDRLNQIESALAAVVPSADPLAAVFTQVIDRLETDFDPVIARGVLSLLASAKDGLSERELQDLMARLPPSVPEPAPAAGRSYIRRLGAGFLKWVGRPLRDPAEKSRREETQAVLRQVRTYLMRHGPLLAFFHRSFREAAQARYLDNPAGRQAAHRLLGDYFDEKWRDADRHALDVVFHHYLEARDWGKITTFVGLEWRRAKRRAYGSDAAFIDDMARLAAAPAGIGLNPAARVVAVALGAALAAADSEAMHDAFERRIAAGDPAAALDQAERAGQSRPVCRAILRLAAAGTAPPPSAVLERAVLLLAASEGRRTADWLAANWHAVRRAGHDADGLAVTVARERAAAATQIGAADAQAMAHLVGAWGPHLTPDGMAAVWDHAFTVVAAVETREPGVQFLIAGDLWVMASRCPTARRPAFLELLTGFARRAGTLTEENTAYRLLALEGYGKALAHLMDAAAVFAFSQRPDFAFGGSLSAGRAERTALRVGAAEAFAALGRAADVAHLAGRFVHPGARAAALAWLLVQGPEERMAADLADFLTVLPAAKSLADAPMDLLSLGSMLTRSHGGGTEGERRLAQAGLRRVAETLAGMPPDREAALRPAVAAMGVSDATRPPPVMSSVPPPPPPAATEWVGRLAAAWRKPSADEAPAEASSTGRLEPDLTAELRSRAERIRRAVGDRCVVGPSYTFILRSGPAEVVGPDRIEPWMHDPRWSDRACVHARAVLDAIAGEDDAFFFGPSPGAVARFDAVYTACAAAVGPHPAVAAALIRCACMAAQDLGRGAASRKLGPERLRAKLLVGRLVGLMAAAHGADAIPLMALTHDCLPFTAAQVIDGLAGRGMDRAAADRVTPALFARIDACERRPARALLLKARWLRRTGQTAAARDRLEQAHALFTQASPAEEEQWYAACAAREMAYIDGPLGFSWAAAADAAVVRCSGQLLAGRRGPGWTAAGKRDAVAGLTADLTRNGLLTRPLPVGPTAMNLIAEADGLPAFPPLAWEDVSAADRPAAVIELLAFAAAEPAVKSEDFADLLEEAAGDDRLFPDLLCEFAGQKAFPLEYVFRMARRLQSRPLPDFIDAFARLARVVRARGHAEFCDQMAEVIDGLKMFTSSEPDGRTMAW